MEERKLYIIQNVGKLYLRFGIRSVTMDDVAQEFGISKKTLYQYFSDKEELVSEVINYYLQNPALDMSKHVSGNAIDSMFAIRDHVANIFKYFNNNIEFDLKKLYPGLYEKVRKVKRQRILDNTTRNITQGIEEGLYRMELDPVLVAKLQVGRMLYTFNPDYQIFTESEVSSMEVFDKLMSYHMHAICTERGIEYYKEQLNKIQNEESV